MKSSRRCQGPDVFRYSGKPSISMRSSRAFPSAGQVDPRKWRSWQLSWPQTEARLSPGLITLSTVAPSPRLDALVSRAVDQVCGLAHVFSPSGSARIVGHPEVTTGKRAPKLSPATSMGCDQALRTSIVTCISRPDDAQGTRSLRSILSLRSANRVSSSLFEDEMLLRAALSE